MAGVKEEISNLLEGLLLPLKADVPDNFEAKERQNITEVLITAYYHSIY
jgi:hypothetical protein